MESQSERRMAASQRLMPVTGAIAVPVDQRRPGAMLNTALFEPVAANAPTPLILNRPTEPIAVDNHKELERISKERKEFEQQSRTKDGELKILRFQQAHNEREMSAMRRQMQEATKSQKQMKEDYEKKINDLKNRHEDELKFEAIDRQRGEQLVASQNGNGASQIETRDADGFIAPTQMPLRGVRLLKPMKTKGGSPSKNVFPNRRTSHENGPSSSSSSLVTRQRHQQLNSAKNHLSTNEFGCQVSMCAQSARASAVRPLVLTKHLMHSELLARIVEKIARKSSSADHSTLLSLPQMFSDQTLADVCNLTS